MQAHATAATANHPILRASPMRPLAQPPTTDAAGGRKDTSPAPSGDATAAVPLNLGIAGKRGVMEDPEVASMSTMSMLVSASPLYCWPADHRIVRPPFYFLAGYVARTGETVAVPREAFRDARFSPDVDERPGSVTQSVLCAALRDSR